jgi:transcriptional regulator with XRE-family HTH domain
MTERERLQHFIEQRGTQEQFAARIGLRRETISRFASGREPISNSFIGRFFVVFGPEAAIEVFGPDATQLQPEAA